MINQVSRKALKSMLESGDCLWSRDYKKNSEEVFIQKTSLKITFSHWVSGDKDTSLFDNLCTTLPKSQSKDISKQTLTLLYYSITNNTRLVASCDPSASMSMTTAKWHMQAKQINRYMTFYINYSISQSNIYGQKFCLITVVKISSTAKIYEFSWGYDII